MTTVLISRVAGWPAVTGRSRSSPKAATLSASVTPRSAPAISAM
jgi:hypothetical protein